MTGKDPEPVSGPHPSVTPYQVYEAKNGHVILALASENKWQEFCRTIGLEKLIDDPRFVNNNQRTANRDELNQIITETFSSMNSEEIISALKAKNVPCGPINNITDLFTDPQLLARNRFISFDRNGQSVPGVANPMNFSHTPIEYTTAAPFLGQHTDEILTGLGYSQAEIDALVEKGVISRT
jgi:crotonobetainyl-CoA:carnitine CoA-transferase CaiB-like acyl-CoA transferase